MRLETPAAINLCAHVQTASMTAEAATGTHQEALDRIPAPVPVPRGSCQASDLLDGPAAVHIGANSTHPGAGGRCMSCRAAMEG